MCTGSNARADRFVFVRRNNILMGSALAVCEMFTYMPTHRQTHKPRHLTSGSMLHVMFHVKSVIRYWTVNIVKIGV